MKTQPTPLKNLQPSHVINEVMMLLGNGVTGNSRSGLQVTVTRGGLSSLLSLEDSLRHGQMAAPGRLSCPSCSRPLPSGSLLAKFHFPDFSPPPLLFLD